MNCGTGNAATHSDSSSKTSVTLIWTAPAVTTATNIKFVYTVVETKTNHWDKHDAQSQVVVQPSTSATTTSVAPTVTTATTTSGSTSAGGVSSGPVTASCGVSKGCFGSEADCVAKFSCHVMSTYQMSSDSKSFTFALAGNNLANSDYMAFGLSTDATMGDDLVFYCSASNHKILVSWNKGKDNVGGVTGVQVCF